MDPVYEILLEKLVYGGEAMGRLPGGRAVFVPFALPEETVRVRLVEEKRGYARAELKEVIHLSPDRIAPLCIHFGVCGGCHYQHLLYEKQTLAKADILRDQLQRIGGITDPPVHETIPSARPYYYRNQVQFHVSPEGKLGYQAWRTNRVIVIQECHLPEAPVNETWPQITIEPFPGLERVSVRAGSDEEVLVNLESSRDEPPELSVEDLPVSATFSGPSGTVVLAGSEGLDIEVQGRHFRVSAPSFFQVNLEVASQMVTHILEHLPLSNRTTLLELYSGVGLFSAFLAPIVHQLAAIESSPSSCQDFVDNLDEFENVELYEGNVEEILPHLEIQPEVVLADPPRGGLGPKVIQAILEKGPTALAYISCDPSTLARDARRLIEGGYQLKQVTPFDMFPQTFHIESISFWEKF